MADVLPLLILFFHVGCIPGCRRRKKTMVFPAVCLFSLLRYAWAVLFLEIKHIRYAARPCMASYAISYTRYIERVYHPPHCALF